MVDNDVGGGCSWKQRRATYVPSIKADPAVEAFDVVQIAILNFHLQET